MLKNRVYKFYNVILTLYIPIMLLLTSLIENITYDKTNDQGGWGGLALFGCIIISILWSLAILFINYIIKSFTKKDITKSISGFALSIINLIIYLNNLNFFGYNMSEFIFVSNIIILLTYVVFLVINNKLLKIDYNKFLNLGIIPLIIYAVAHIVAWHIGKYLSSSEGFRGTTYEQIAFFIVIVWGVYYLIHTVKNNIYVTKLELIIYNIFNIINAMSLSNFAIIEDAGFGGPGMAAIMSFLYSLIPIVYLLILNLILYVRIKTKKCVVNNENKLSLNLVYIIFYIIICVSPFLYGYIGNNLSESKALSISIDYLIKEYGNKEYKVDKEKCDSYECHFTIKTEKAYEIFSVNINKDTFKIMYTEELKCLDDESCLNASKDIALNYMNNKYGNDEFKIVNAKEDKSCAMFDCYKKGYLITLKSKTLNDDFVVRLDNDLDILEERFTFLYFSKITNSDIKNYYDLYNYLKQNIADKIDKEIYDKYNIEFTQKSVKINIDKLVKNNYKKLPTLEDLEKFIEIDNIKFTINKKFDSNQKEECVEYIINFIDDLYDNYNFVEDNATWFNFSYNNPFSNNKSYEDGGYIKVSNVYMVYLDATPTIVNK